MAVMTSAGITFKIGSTTIGSCYSTPAMGVEPQKIDVSSFDDTVNKAYTSGLQDITSFNFDFRDETSNMNAAQALDSNASNNYEVAYPDGSKYTWSGTHRTFKLETSVDNPINFRVACAVEGDLTYTPGTAL